MPYCLSHFSHIRPPHEIDQEKILDWVAEAHARGAAKFENQEKAAFQQTIREKLVKIGLGKERIAKRGIQVCDVLQTDWSQMPIYPVEEMPHGHGLEMRSQLFEKEVTEIFAQFYPNIESLPKHLIHVTCTGYVAPSPAQKIVSLHHAGSKTTVTNAYHMGCYASIPAIRIGCGYTALEPSDSVDIVHTEISSLHMHPLKHSSEQLLVQSLFADGYIKYSLSAESDESSHLKVLALHEETIPLSTESMTWRCGDKGFTMTLAREVPVLIARRIQGYLKTLCEKAGLSPDQIPHCFFAIHPGGPKVLDQIQARLGLEAFQLRHSEQVLRYFGNMSSATLPHIWQRMLDDPSIPSKAKIISLAFGPGLCISGGLFEKS